MRRNRDRTPAAGTPRVRLTVELPHKWSSYLVNDVPDAFDDDDADDPWDRAAADREIAKIEAEGYTIVGQAGDGSFGRHGGTHGMLTTYQLVNHQAHADDAAAGLWRFMPPGTESEYLILHDTEGITWLPAHWSHKLSDPRYVIDEIDLEWPDEDDDDRPDPNDPPWTDVAEMPPAWRLRRRSAPPPQDLEAWDEHAHQLAVRSLRARGWTLDQALDGCRLGWFLEQWGPLRPYVAQRTNGPRAADDATARPAVDTGTRRPQ